MRKVELDYMDAYSSNALIQAAYVSSEVYSSDLIPTMTSDITPSGEAVGNSLAVGDAYLAFDDSTLEADVLKWSIAGDMWVSYEFTASKIITRYTIQTNDEVAQLDRLPKDWTFEGWTGSEWTILDTQTNETGWSNLEKRTYSFSNITAYIKYRIRVSANNGDGSYCTIGELEMIETNLQSYSESTIKQQGSYSLKGIAKQTDSLNDTLTRTVSPTIDLSNKNLISLWVRASRTGNNFKIGFHDSGGTTIEKAITINSANEWERKFINIEGVTNSNKDAIDEIKVTITNADAANTFYVDYIEAAMDERATMFGVNF